MSWSKKYRHAEHAHTVTEHGSSAAGQEHGAHHSHEHVHGANQEQSYSPMHTHHHGEGHAPMTEPLTEPLLELRNLSAFFQKQGSLHACNVDSSASLPEMLAEMRNYGDGPELELIDQLGQVCSLMELYSVMMQPPEDESS